MEKLTSNLIITFYIITLKVDSSLWLFSILRKKFSSAKKGRKRWTMSRYRRTIKVGQIRLNLRVLKNYSTEILVSGFCRYKQNEAYRSTVVFPPSYISISSFYYGIGNCDWIYLGSTSVQFNTTMLAYYRFSTDLVKWNFKFLLLESIGIDFWNRYFVDFRIKIKILKRRI